MGAIVLYEGRMRGLFRRLLPIWTLLLCLLSGACHEDAPGQKTEESQAPKKNQLPTLSIREDTPNLLLTYVDDQGDFHVVQKPSDVPPEARKLVRVVVTDKEAGTGELVYVTDLKETTPDGNYRLKTMTRAAWDEIGASKRKSRLEALAPPPPSAAPSASAAGAPHGTKGPSSRVSAIVYGAAWCKPCHDAERYLKQRGVSVVKKDIDESDAAAAEMKRKLERAGLHGASIPVIDVMGQILVGFSPSALDRAIQSAQGAEPL